VNERDYNYERGYACAIAKGASNMIADEFAQVFADVLALPTEKYGAHTPAEAWDTWKMAVGQEHTERVT
jgi:hypothetical protein